MLRTLLTIAVYRFIGSCRRTLYRLRYRGSACNRCYAHFRNMGSDNVVHYRHPLFCFCRKDIVDWLRRIVSASNVGLPTTLLNGRQFHDRMKKVGRNPDNSQTA